MSKLAGIQAVERPPTLSRRAYLQIQQAIRDGVLKSGVMYSENELAEQLGMSRTPVREAVISLSREGIIEIASQRGFHLRELSPLERTEIFDLRALLEPYVAGRLATTRTSEQVDQLRKLLDEQQLLVDNPKDPQTFLDLDERFHLLQAEYLGLERTRSTMANLRGAMWLLGFEALSLPHRYAAVVREHRAILDAIERQNPEDARLAAHEHILQTARAADHLDQ
ncbi:GntR family transcriptional regulator [Rhodococcus koreensis]|uniref:GntR family transcriptional regulator n=1 Tax=Rhodococcus koreensis TaxID=99653 RepID=UPI00366D566B